MGSAMTDVLFLHVPKFRNYYKPLNRFSFVLLPPVGLLGLADYLRQNHCSTRVIHLGVEYYKYGGIDLRRILAGHQPTLVGLDLHWHFQSYDVIETARKVKEVCPDVGIVLGGFTASFFAEEILRTFDCVDFVVRGDAEEPLLRLVKQHHSGRAFHQVPNLAYRQDGAICSSPLRYVADPSVVDSISYTDFTLMKDYPSFVNSFSQSTYLGGLSAASQRALLGWKKTYPVNLGRGCVYNCSFCGGSAGSQSIINKRTGACLRSVESVLSSLKDLERFGFEATYLGFDPLPAPKSDEYFLAIFEGIRRLHISLGMEVERFCLPTREFIRSFRDLPGKDSLIILSPNSHSEEVRRKNGLYRYSNEELEQCLNVMEEEGVNCALYFACGLPFETAEDLEAMVQYQKTLRRKFRRTHCRTSLIEIEPGSPMSRDPRAYGVRLDRSSFVDYYRYHSLPSQNHILEMGYERIGCPGPDETANFLCRHFCSHFRTGRVPPFLCRTLCSMVSAMWKVGAFQLFDKIVGPHLGRPRKPAADASERRAV
jgi:radical SAM superfamily enzyme YgiQ (UPF0313 family)